MTAISRPAARLGLMALALASPHPAHAWGSAGHKIIAMIATNRLTPAAQQHVQRLLADDPNGSTLPAVAQWADAVKKVERPETENWHFVNIPVGERPTTFDRRRDCRPNPRRGDCIVAAVEHEIRTLGDAGAGARARRDALKFVTHLIGDLHQPLHCAEHDRDSGGNGVQVVFLGQQGWTLHDVWDNGLIAQSGLSPSKQVKRLTQWLRSQDTDRMAAGTPTDWANETHAVAVDHAYHTPTGRWVRNRTRLDDRYVAAVSEIVDEQLARAGVRLAAVLNIALR